VPGRKYGPGEPARDVESHRKRALLLLAQAREAQSGESRAEFERLARLYERLAERAERRGSRLPTLGSLLNSYHSRRVAEADWVSLVQAIGQRDHQAFQTLYLWTHRFVFAFLMAVTNDTFAAEALSLRVFQRLWREAPRYDPARDTVLAWIMNQARVCALDREPLTFKETLLGAAGAAGAEGSVEAIEGARKLAQHATVGAIEEEPDMEQVGPGLFCKVLASDHERMRLSMLVRLLPRGAYPAHAHAGVEQLYLLSGELWIDDRKLQAGAYNCAQPGSADERVWSETGCSCILVTSSSDVFA
jgi:ChrR-like protein with cupin domain